MYQGNGEGAKSELRRSDEGRKEDRELSYYPAEKKSIRVFLGKMEEGGPIAGQEASKATRITIFFS